MSLPTGEWFEVFTNISLFLEFFVNLQSVKWSLIGVAFAIFKFKKDGRVKVLRFWWELLFVFLAVYIGSPIAILNGIPEQYLPVLAAIIGYSGVDGIVKTVKKFLHFWLEYFIEKKTNKTFKKKQDYDDDPN
ncbi:hypothetical protein CKF54_00410 [Psittacicella hinzii]|uniref:Uncharacterized protein n=1 Tax=Psittacicella hinzii TaxID=2028575 RepID=A0A3A1Y8H2_9GAMM|nr:hypothetical protein [Psittacicella hinzii]RIY34492.1 hypothetical protein CKF54_00410 [Psittacicella hinzii]